MYKKFQDFRFRHPMIVDLIGGNLLIVATTLVPGTYAALKVGGVW